MMMTPQVKSVQAMANYCLRLLFSNGEERMYDVRPLLNQGGVFRELMDESAFRSVHSWHGTVQWAGDQDICPDTLYEDSVPVQAFGPAMVRETGAKYTTKTSRFLKAKRERK